MRNGTVGGVGGLFAFLRVMARDSLVLMLPVLVLAPFVVQRSSLLASQEFVSGTFTLDDGTVVEAHTSEEIDEVQAKYRGRIERWSLHRRTDKTVTDFLAAIYGGPVLILSAGLFLVYAAWMERRKLRSWFHPRPRDALVGAALGLVLAVGIGAAEKLAVARGWMGAEDPYAGIARWWLFPLVACVLGPIGEELYFRGRLQDAARETIGGRSAWFAPAVPFVLLHPIFPGRIVVPVLCYTVLALALGWVRERTGRMVAPVVLHLVYNSSYLYLVAPVLGLG